MGRPARTLWLAAAGIALSACGSAGSVGGGPTGGGAIATPVARIAPNTVVVFADSGSGSSLEGIVVHLVRPDGTEANRLTLKPGSRPVRAAGSRIFVISENDDSIKAVHRDGSVESLGHSGSPSPTAFTASPDGTKWMWGMYDAHGVGQVHVAGDGMADRVVAESRSDQHAVRPFSWTPVGAFIADSLTGIGGYILFNDVGIGPIKQLDPATWSTRAVPGTDTCTFSDMSRDGTVACFNQVSAQGLRILKLVSRDGNARTIELAMPRFTQFGDAYFSPDGRQLTVAGATSVGSNGGPEEYGTDLVTVKDASIKRLAVDGLRPNEQLQWQCWLADGSLMMWRPEGSTGGQPGVYLVKPDGSSEQLIGGKGMPIGVLTN